MANKTIFQTLRGALVPAVTASNDAGATAYALCPKAALARIAATGCVTRTYYCSAEVQLDRVLALANEVDTDFLAQTAIYSRQKGYMKDMPALLCAVLATRDRDRLIEVFPQVIDNGKDKALVEKIAARMSDPAEVKRARVFPYQLLAAYQNTGEAPTAIREALQDAMEIAIANVPSISGSVVVCPDVSGSMQMAVTGYQKGASSKVRCIDVAALVSAAFLRKNRAARVLPFEVDVVKVKLNPRDSVMTNATHLAKIGGGGTNCSAPLAMLNAENASPDLVIFVSDNESWADPKARRGTSMMVEWEKLKARNPKAKLVCIDIVPNATTQAPDRKDILNIAGFSDQVFDIIASFAAGADNENHWIQKIESQPLNPQAMTA